jgi:hypothetical protein
MSRGASTSLHRAPASPTLRSVLVGPGDLWLDWVVLAAWAIGGFFLSMRLFRWQYAGTELTSRAVSRPPHPSDTGNTPDLTAAAFSRLCVGPLPTISTVPCIVFDKIAIMCH